MLKINNERNRRRVFTAAGALVAAAVITAPASAQNVIDEWATVKTPEAPKLKEATVDPKTMAVISMDFNVASCTPAKRARCAAQLPRMGKFLTDARAKGVTIIHTLAGSMKPTDIAKEVAPVGDEKVISSGPDKFIGTDLEKTLKDKGITTLIAIGTAAHGAVLYTTSAAAFRGFKTIVPVDGMSSDNAFQELAAAYIMSSAPRVGDATTLTKFDMIKF
jgi:nicotinamidase-related amidase